MSNYFIMLNGPTDVHFTPMVKTNKADPNETDVLLFETFEEAKTLADDHDYAQAYGYEIFQRGDGEIG